MNQYRQLQTRRQFFGRTATGIGIAALASLLDSEKGRADEMTPRAGILRTLHHAAKAKRVIYLFMSGGPSHIDLLDYKPELRRHHGEELPASVRMGQRITGMTAGQRSFPCVAPMFRFAQHGRAGTWVSELLLYIGANHGELRAPKCMKT